MVHHMPPIRWIFNLPERDLFRQVSQIGHYKHGIHDLMVIYFQKENQLKAGLEESTLNIQNKFSKLIVNT